MSDVEKSVRYWTHYWMPQSAEIFSDFLGKSPVTTEMPELDLMDPVWIDEQSSVISLLRNDAGVVDFVCLANTPAQHGAWLSAWSFASGRQVWIPDTMDLLVDIESRKVILQQRWKNPACAVQVTIGQWADYHSPEWAVVLDMIARRGPFRVTLPANVASYQALCALQDDGTTTMPLEMIVWAIQRVHLVVAPADAPEGFVEAGSLH